MELLTFSIRKRKVLTFLNFFFRNFFDSLSGSLKTELNTGIFNFEFRKDILIQNIKYKKLMNFRKIGIWDIKKKVPGP